MQDEKSNSGDFFSRLEIGISVKFRRLKDFLEASGISRAMYYRLRDGQEPRKHLVLEVAELLGCSPEWLFTGVGATPKIGLETGTNRPDPLKQIVTAPLAEASARSSPGAAANALARLIGAVGREKVHGLASAAISRSGTDPAALADWAEILRVLAGVRIERACCYVPLQSDD